MKDPSGTKSLELPVVQKRSVVSEWAELIKVEHTVFALPFALSGMLLASNKFPTTATWLWVILAFTGARAAAMALNRVIDGELDSLNPRTSNRAIAAGRIEKKQAIIFVIAAFALMIFVAMHLPPMCLALSPIAVIWLTLYSYTKRFTSLCHLWLGVALGGAALGGWVAASGTLSEPTPWLLALAVATWVAGFDIIYALQDISFDQKQLLQSVPACLGIRSSLFISSALHLITVISLFTLGNILSLGVAYWIGLVLVTSMLIWEHSLVKEDDLSKINAAFFNVNGIVSIAMFCAVFLDKILR